jgi:hypothetical protein
MRLDAITVKRTEDGFGPTEVYLFDHEEFGGVEGDWGSVDRAESALRAWLVAAYGEKNIVSMVRSGTAHVFMMHQPKVPSITVSVPLAVQ